MQGKLQWALSLGLLVFLLVTLTIGWVLLQMACSLEWVCTKSSAALNRLMKPYHLSPPRVMGGSAHAFSRHGQ